MDPLQRRLAPVFDELNTFLNEKKLISRLELRLKIKNLIKTHNLSVLDTEEFQKQHDFPLHQFIFLTLTSGAPHSIQAPLLHEKIPYKQMIFYHSHSYKIDESILESAYKDVCLLQLQLLQNITSQFLTNANYSITSLTSESITAQTNGKLLICHMFCSILHLAQQIDTFELDPNQVFIIPPGTSIDPFIKFYQDYSNTILLAEANVWLIDTEMETVSRFIGVPNDKKLITQFTRSQLATLIERNWRPTIDTLD